MLRDSFGPTEGVGVAVHRRGSKDIENLAGLRELFIPQGVFNFEHWRGGRLLNKWAAPNTVTTQGKNSILDVYFRSQTQITTWYMGLVNNTSTPTFAAGDTAAQIGGTNDWTEMTAYTGGARKNWSSSLSAASSGSITNSTVITFPITGTDTLYGAFIVSASSGTSGVLWSGVAFPSTVAVASGDDVKVTYTLSS